LFFSPLLSEAYPRLLQVMPWPVFQDMTDRDLVAISAYLAALPAP